MNMIPPSSMEPMAAAGDWERQERIVLTLDAGGTGLKFTAIQGRHILAGPRTLPTEPENLERCLANIIAGFEDIGRGLPHPACAISFAFPGPADYPAGIISNLGNLPAFRGGVALGPLLEDHFGLPVFINNDGDLFAYGEALAGFLPEVNQQLASAGSPKRYHNLLGLTVGTGLGGGIVSRGKLFIGDNSSAGEVWLLRHSGQPGINAEEGASIRAVRRVYAELCGMPVETAPEPRDIHAIGKGLAPGNREAALAAFARLGAVVGDVMAQALTLIDGLAVIGGGISGAQDLFLPAAVAALNSDFADCPGRRRLVPRGFNYEDPNQRAQFLRGETRELTVPGSQRKIPYDPLQRTAIGISRLGTSEAVAIGAYAFALHQF